ncbi:hypothetical protein [Hymenobacter siberiensis]|uniref:hypothetical protein n=1 Tax=Hymenobacter siberiensis TaxID=2848396 RepID=UPI001C1DEDDB|nr:hypothetical protein [Hymenobacter siberiensis]
MFPDEWPKFPHAIVFHLHLLLLAADSVTNYWQYISPVASPIISALVTFSVLYLNRHHSETTKHKDIREAATRAAVKAEDDWKAGQVRELQALRELAKHTSERFVTMVANQNTALRTAESQRLQDKMKSEQDFAAVTGILRENIEAQRLMAQITANVSHLEKTTERHDSDFVQLRHTLSTMNEHILKLAGRHEKFS